MLSAASKTLSFQHFVAAMWFLKLVLSSKLISKAQGSDCTSPCSKKQSARAVVCLIFSSLFPTQGRHPGCVLFQPFVFQKQEHKGIGTPRWQLVRQRKCSSAQQPPFKKAHS
eukprot:689607-Pelagomonas_calceolata.AAC.1